MTSRKITRSWKNEPIDIKDAPSVYMSTHTQIKQEDKGLYKLRARNDKILAELSDWAHDAETRVQVNKVGNRIFYTVKDTGVTVSLVHS